MAEPVTRCQCGRLGPGFPCSAQMTAEDLLCDACRAARVPGAAHAAVPDGLHFNFLNSRPGFPGTYAGRERT